MATPTGRREASTQATRAALTAAAKRLFSERGFEQTTVRDIARAADVTERTFYRYFDGKKGLITSEFLAWLAILADAIRSRPANEPPFTAVHRAMISVGRLASAEAAPAPVWLFSGRPFAGVRSSGVRPLLRLEASVTDAIQARLRAGSGAGGGLADAEEEFRAQVIARVAVAAFRSAAIRHRELPNHGVGASRSLEQRLGQAFAALRGQAEASA